METGIKVIDAMTKKPVTVSPDTNLEEIAKLMEDNNIGSVLIKEKNKLVGIVTEQDIVRRVVAKGIDTKNRVKNFMSTTLSTIDPGSDIFDALNLMKDRNVKTLPVKDGDKLVGMLALKDILKIQPSLFEIWAEKMEIKEENSKPIFRPLPKEGICEACGEYSEKLFEVGDSLLCKVCKKGMES